MRRISLRWIDELSGTSEVGRRKSVQIVRISTTYLSHTLLSLNMSIHFPNF